MYWRTLQKSMKRYRKTLEIFPKIEIESKMKIVEFVRMEGVEKLCRIHPVYVCPHSKYPNLLHFSFKASKRILKSSKNQEFHNQIELNELQEESHGSLILDTKNFKFLESKIF